MLSNTILCVALCAAVTLGDDGTSTSSGRSTTWYAPPRTPGWTTNEAVTQLNARYMAFDESDDSTPLGVTFSMAATPNSFSGNIFCHEFFPDQACYMGKADCAASASIMNHKMMIEQGHVATPIHSHTGFVFNQTLVETYFGKCAYIWDGAADRGVNNRCGVGAHAWGYGSELCDHPQSAYKDICWMKQPDHHCTRDDPELTEYYCKCDQDWCSSDYGVMDAPSRRTVRPCYYEMPAMWLDYENPTDATVTETNHLRDSMKQRMLFQTTYPDQVREWNEVIIDNRLLVPQMRRDPTHTILAIVYIPSTPGAYDEAVQMRNEYQSTYQVDCVGCEIPIIAMDITVNVAEAGGPFSAPGASRSHVTI